MLPGRRWPDGSFTPNATRPEGEAFVMTTDLSETEKPRRQYTGSQVFPIVAGLMFGVSILVWFPVLQAGQSVDNERLLVGSAILLAAFLAGELFPLQIE